MAKQYLEKDWSKGQSHDPFVGYKGQFQYARNVNIRDINNGICLSSKLENSNDTGNNPTSRFLYVGYDNNYLIRMERGGFGRVYKQSNSGRPTTSYLIGDFGGSNPHLGLKFQNNEIWAFASGGDIYVFDDSTGQGVLAPIPTPTWTDPYSGVVYTYNSATAVLNYSNTMILVGDGNKLRRYISVATPELPIGWKLIREFEEGTEIKGLEMEGNYLQIFVNNNNLDTKIHYAKGTFDVEESGLVQTVDINNMILLSVVSDNNGTYALFRNSTDSLEYRLYEIKGYSKKLIKKTRLDPNNNQRQEFSRGEADNLYTADDTLYCAMGDGIRSFKKVNNIWAGVLERTTNDFLGNYFPGGLHVFGDYIYLSCQYQYGGEYRELRANLEWISPTYQPSGFLMGRVYDGGQVSIGKNNVELLLGYLLDRDSANPGEIRVRLRRDRESLGFGNFFTVRTLDDVRRMWESVKLSSDTGFKKEWNTLEYEIELIRGTDEEVTPRFYEFNLIYDYTRRLK